MNSLRQTVLRLSTLFTAMAALPAHGAEDEQLWLQTIAQGPISGDIVYFAEVQSRFGRDMDGLDQMLLRPAIGVKLSDRLTVFQGYAYVRTPRSGGGDTREHRSFQQINWSLGKVAGGPLSSRTRIEQRWVSSGDDMGWRLRQWLRLAVPLTGKPGGVSALTYAEGLVALNDTDWGARKGFDRLRSFAGLELPFAGKSTVEVGYLNQYVKNRGRADDVDHVLLVTLQLRR
ncbi:DUF2490 domain-containing protein [Sphingobium terrigena]|uniref:DUF2490 domain-containing protein n=1 Tax=Sphingobium terrigena TaxID=2304063 RepID=A0A418YT59_9SPHN|nr:DUF2490 domain-containing protein [Sphingobium terrigena]RJG55087.1 DUF2490 domain-containing protein [Sphingobium terrigena]